jgi:hypothetical protein
MAEQLFYFCNDQIFVSRDKCVWHVVNIYIFINKFSLDGWNPFGSNGVGSLGVTY